MKKRYESIEKPDKCPKCGAPVYQILYGLPTIPEEEYFNTYHEHVIYGGCCISEDDPEWACSKCGAEIYNVTHVPYKKKITSSQGLRHVIIWWQWYKASYYIISGHTQKQGTQPYVKGIKKFIPKFGFSFAYS